MARTLKIDRRIVAAACMELWEWADSETTDGHVPGATYDFVDSLVMISGFANALDEMKWLRSTEQGITFVNFGTHNGDTAKARAMAASKKRRQRANTVSPQLSPSCPLPEGTQGVTREEKRREEKTEQTTTTARGSPPPRFGEPTFAVVIDIAERLLTRPLVAARNEVRLMHEWLEREGNRDAPFINGVPVPIDKFLIDVWLEVERAGCNDSVKAMLGLADTIIDRCRRQGLPPGQRKSLNPMQTTTQTIDFSKL